MTLVVNFFAGPGTGKSTNTALTFGKLKTKGVNAEIVHEFAKDLVWEERHAALGFQPYIVGKQMYHIHRLLGKVDVILTDAPILFCSHIYGDNSETFKRYVVEVFKTWDTFNISLQRNLDIHPYKEAGRNQTLQESMEIDARILSMLYIENIPSAVYRVEEETSSIIAEDIMHELERKEEANRTATVSL